MTKENYLSLKQDLKSLAKEIKNHKQNLKTSQRALSDFEYRIGHYNSLEGRDSDQKEWVKLLSPVSDTQYNLLEMQSNYRAMHILYSLERGRSLDQIEKSKDGYWKTITYRSKMSKYVKEYGFDNLNLLPKETLQSLGWIEGSGQIRMFTREEMRFESEIPSPRRVVARRIK